ncbi:MAG: M20/M25/M40 family metallo-hydrolase [Planctomycetes bacterium]|nr:M20/M25/M40 family metallo-hydrolase [Planctomycetota bacterium]
MPQALSKPSAVRQISNLKSQISDLRFQISSFRATLLRLALSALILLAPVCLSAAETTADVERRLAESVGYLASDELEGRGVTTQGIGLAADYIGQQFAAAGLNTRLYNGTPFQTFTMVTGANLGPNNRLMLVGPAEEGESPRSIELKVGLDFTPMPMSGAGKFDLPLVFVGYGITAADEKYDDYAGIDVKDKAVIILRKEPQQDNPHSAFNGTENSPHALYTRKISNAYEHGAAGIIFCTDNFEIQQRVDQRLKQLSRAIDELAKEQAKFQEIAGPSREQIEAHRKQVAERLDRIKRASDSVQAEYDPVLPFRSDPEGEGREIPIFHCRRAFLDRALAAALKTNLPSLEKQIDEGPTPHSRELPGWRITGEADVKRTESQVRNVIGVLDGTGPHAEETIVVGAHYDHLGRGETGSLARGSKEIHNGADDNGSGTAVLIEVARQLAQRPERLARRVVFIAFTAEERGLIGSARYVRQPLFPLEKTIAMLNMDMVGRLTDEKLIVYGTGTAKELEPLVDRLGEKYGFVLTKLPQGFGPSDHSSFYAKQIPVLHFFTGLHSDYHRPSDDTPLLNMEGMRRVAQMVADSVVELANAEQPPKYVEVKGSADVNRGGGDRPYFGSIPDFSQDQPGYAISGATADSPAAKAGLKGGDVILKFGESKIGNLEDFDSALRKHKAGDKVPVIVRREGQELTLEVVLEAPR